MSFLIDQIKDQKLLEMEVDFNSFIIENKISESAMIHTMIFDKKVFVEEKEVREYLKLQYFWNPSITENDESFIAVLVSPSQMDSDTEIEIEIRRGVVAQAADLLPVMTFDDVAFNSKGEVNLSSKFGEIHLNSGMPHIIEIARVAEGEHVQYGTIKITQENLESMVVNFNNKVTGVDLSVNEDHKKNEAFGWFKDVYLSHDKQTLYAQIHWNSKGTIALSEKEYRYFSPEFSFNYKEELSGKEFGATLKGGALTNYPFLKMDAIVDLNNKPQQKEDEMPQGKTIDLSTHTDKVVELNTQISTIQVELNAKTTENTVLEAKVKQLEETIELSSKHAAFDKLFSNGHFNAAQLKAAKEGKPMLEVIALSTKTNMEPSGKDTKPATTVELNDSQKSIAADLGLTDEEYQAVEL